MRKFQSLVAARFPVLGMTVGIAFYLTVNGAPLTRFGPATNFPAGNSTRTLITADFNSDGKSDVAVGRAFNGVSVLLGLGDGALSTPTNYPYPVVADTLTSGDFNNDGKLDIVAAGSYNTRILLGDGNGNFSVLTNLANASGYPKAVAVADFNYDGKADLAIANDYGVIVAFGQGDGSFTNSTNYALANPPSDVRVVNGNGRLNLVVSLQNYSSGTSNSLCVLTNKGNGTFGTPQYYTGERGTTGVRNPSLAVRDFNGDELPDVAVLNLNPNNSTSNAVSIWLNNGSGIFFRANRYTVGFTPEGITEADFNGDGNVDLVIRGASLARVLDGNHNGSFIVGPLISIPYNSPIYPRTLGSGDFNGDGTPDLVLTSSSDNSVAIMLNQTPPTLQLTPLSGYNQVSWLNTFGAGFTLEYTTNLCAPDDWQPFPYPPVLIGDQKAVTDWGVGGARFYRLRKQ